MGLFSKLMKKSSVPQGEGYSIREALGESELYDLEMDVVNLCLELYKAFDVNTPSGRKLKLGSIKGRLDDLTKEEFGALNFMLTKLSAEMQDPPEAMKKVVDTDKLLILLPVVQEILPKTAHYYLHKN